MRSAMGWHHATLCVPAQHSDSAGHLPWAPLLAAAQSPAPRLAPPLSAAPVERINQRGLLVKATTQAAACIRPSGLHGHLALSPAVLSGTPSSAPRPSSRMIWHRTLRAFFFSRFASCRSLLYFSLRTTLFLMNDVFWPAVAAAPEHAWSEQLLHYWPAAAQSSHPTPSGISCQHCQNCCAASMTCQHAPAAPTYGGIGAAGGWPLIVVVSLPLAHGCAACCPLLLSPAACCWWVAAGSQQNWGAQKLCRVCKARAWTALAAMKPWRATRLVAVAAAAVAAAAACSARSCMGLPAAATRCTIT